MEFLLAAGADATTVTFNVRRETALHLAVQHAHVSCAERLMASTVVEPGGHPCRLANVISIGVRDASDAWLTALNKAMMSHPAIRFLVPRQCHHHRV